MDAEILVSLRPTERTMKGVAESREKIAKALSEAKAQRDELLARRHDVVATGSVDEIKAVRKAIEVAEHMVGELEDLDEAVAAQVGAIKREIAISRDQKLFTEADEKAKRWTAWFSTKYADLATKLAEGLAMERDAVIASLHLTRARTESEKHLTLSELPQPEKYNRLYPNLRGRFFFEVIQLPGASESSGDAIWWHPALAGPSGEALALGRKNAENDALRRENSELKAALARAGTSSLSSSGQDTGPGQIHASSRGIGYQFFQGIGKGR